MLSELGESVLVPTNNIIVNPDDDGKSFMSSTCTYSDKNKKVTHLITIILTWQQRHSLEHTLGPQSHPFLFMCDQQLGTIYPTLQK